MPVDIYDFAGRATSGLLGLVSGAAAAWLVTRWKLHRERQSVLRGDARDTIVVEQHIVETGVAADGRKTPVALRMRSLGQAQVDRAVPNGYLAAELLDRAFHVTPRHTLISMEGSEGSYLLETLMNFVCDRVRAAGFERDQYVMAPCCEPAGLALHQPIVIILISVADLALFETWPACRDVQVERGSDGARVMTLLELARRFRAEQEKMAALRKSGQRTTHVETSYVLDLALDKRSTAIPVKEVPWGRFEDVLRQMNLEGGRGPATSPAPDR